MMGFTRGNGRRGKYHGRDIVEAEWRPVRSPWKKEGILLWSFLAFLFFGVSTVFFIGSGTLDYWELKNHGEETLAQLIDLEYSPQGVNSSASFGYDLLTVSFRDHEDHLRTVQFYERGRYAFENGINPYNPHPSLPKDVWIVYSRKNNKIAELRDYRNHRLWMAGFALLFASAYPVIFYLSRKTEGY